MLRYQHLLEPHLCQCTTAIIFFSHKHNSFNLSRIQSVNLTRHEPHSHNLWTYPSTIMSITLIHITRHAQLTTAHDHITARYITMDTCTFPYFHLFALIYIYYIYIPLPQVEYYKLGKCISSPFTQLSCTVLIFCTYISVNQPALNICNLYNHPAVATHHTISPTNV